MVIAQIRLATFTLPHASHVRLVVYDVLSRPVYTVLDEPRQAGQHEIRFDSADLPNGLYLYRIQTGTTQDVGQMLLVR